ncbi:MAG: hypothetical protein ACJATM_001473 [Alphaproteobacteria bacterium]|jgi:hypothetical protein
MTSTEDTTLYVVIANLLLSPLLQYLLHSRCTKVKLCCIECDRTILENENGGNTGNNNIV